MSSNAVIRVSDLVFCYFNIYCSVRKDFASFQNGRQTYLLPRLEEWLHASTDQNDFIAKMSSLKILQGLSSNIFVCGEHNTILLNASGTLALSFIHILQAFIFVSVCFGVFHRPLWLLELICVLLNEDANRIMYNSAAINQGTVFSPDILRKLEGILQGKRDDILLQQYILESFTFIDIEFSKKEMSNGVEVMRSYGCPGVGSVIFGNSSRNEKYVYMFV